MSVKPESLNNQSSSNLQEVSEAPIIREVKKVEFVKPLRIITEMQDSANSITNNLYQMNDRVLKNLNS